MLSVWSSPKFYHSVKAVDYLVNSLLNKKLSDWSKLKALADDKLNVTEQLNL